MDSHIQICICSDADCMDTDCMYADCMYTDSIDTNCNTMDCINANHVDAYNCNTIFCDTLNHAYKYAQVMSSLDFDNVKSNRSSSNIPGSILAGLLLAPMAYQISCRQHGGQDDSILSAKIIRIAPETSSF
jgi:hypothetical protein